MDNGTGDQPLTVMQGPSSPAVARAPAGEGSANSNGITRVMNWFEKYVLVLVIGGLISGIAVASVSNTVVDRVDTTINIFMDWYSFIAPVAIFLILSPSLARMFATRKTGKFGLLVLNWFAIRKVLASIWAIAFILVVFRIPFLPQGSVSLADGLGQTMGTLGDMMLTSTYFWAMYAAIAVSLISIKVERLTRFLEKIMDIVEVMGSYLLPIMPVFMFGIGAYIYGLPGNVQEQVGLNADGRSVLLDLNIWGWVTSPQTPTGMITIYVLGALLTAVACFMWQFVFLVLARAYEPRFSIIGYFKNYWIKVYPLLWATSSEALATPLQLHLTKKHAPWIPSSIRRFAIGVGSYMDINSTIINVFILGTIVLLILGLDVSVVELLLLVPVVLLISYGVPGIPGELVLFAGPMATMLNIPEPMLPIFLAVYLGIQLGLPDSFRTGSNSTDDYVQAILINAVYEKRYAPQSAATDVRPVDVGVVS